MPPQSNTASTKENPGRNVNQSNRSTVTSKSQLSNRTNTVREIGQRPRKPSEKVQHQIAVNDEAAEHRKAQAARKQVRAQCQAPDTEDNGDVFNKPESDDDDELQTFTMRSVITKPATIKKNANQDRYQTPPPQSHHVNTPHPHSQPLTKKKVLIHSEGRMPIARQVVHDTAEDPSSPMVPGPDDDDSFDVEHIIPQKHRSPSPEDFRDTQVPRTNKSHPKTADYNKITQQCIIQAIREYRCHISADLPFPDHPEETTMACKSWDQACRELKADIKLTPSIIKVITNRGSHTRGELKSKARPIVETYYGFKSGHNRKIIAKNREIAEGLKDAYGYAYKIHSTDHTKRKGLYRNLLIQKVINAMWF